MVDVIAWILTYSFIGLSGFLFIKLIWCCIRCILAIIWDCDTDYVGDIIWNKIEYRLDTWRGRRCKKNKEESTDDLVADKYMGSVDPEYRALVDKYYDELRPEWEEKIVDNNVVKDSGTTNEPTLYATYIPPYSTTAVLNQSPFVCLVSSMSCNSSCRI